MCGIFGFVPAAPSKGLLDVALIALHQLEYRGYDSAGIGLVTADGNSAVIKSAGNVVALKQKMELHDSDGACVIAHTRWATHGVASDANAHPHASDPQAHFIVVHNGIVTNANELRAELSRGDAIVSDTDTEVVAKMLFEAYQRNPATSFASIVASTLQNVQGSNAFLVASRMFPGTIVAYKRGAPIVYIQNEKGSVLSSDISALMDDSQTELVCRYMQDGQVLVANGTTCCIQGADTLFKENSVVKHLPVPGDTLDLGTFQSYLEKEIFSQPASLTSTISSFMSPSDIVVDKIQQAQKLVLVGCGTSTHACLAARDVLRKDLYKPVFVESASSFLEDEFPVTHEDVCLFVSQSGETADTIAALKYARSCGAFTLALTNCPNSSICTLAECALLLNAGREVSVASTKAYTSQISALVMLSACVAGRPFQKDALFWLPAFVEEALQVTDGRVQDLAEWISGFDHILLVGRSSDFATCAEGALKIKEVPYVHGEAILAGELKHGPLAMIDDSVLVIVVATGPLARMTSVIEQLRARKANVLAIVTDDAPLPEGTPSITVPKAPFSPLQSVLNIVPLQLVALNLARNKNRDVDRPRHLAKSVTVSD